MKIEGKRKHIHNLILVQDFTFQLVRGNVDSMKKLIHNETFLPVYYWRIIAVLTLVRSSNKCTTFKVIFL